MAKSFARRRLVLVRLAVRRGKYNAHRAKRRKRLRCRALGVKVAVPLKEQPAWRRPVRTFECPPVMNLSSHYSETMGLILGLRDWSSKVSRTPVHIDFKSIRLISPAAALLLAAELDRWNQLRPSRKLRAVDVALWDPEVRQLLREMGFFSLLGIDEKRLDCEFPEPKVTDPRFLPFYAGEDSGGSEAEKLRDRIEHFAGRLKDRYALYDGLVEAMTNVSHHAYPGKSGLRRWWISASVDAGNNKLTVLCLDHGVGIPRTLPRTNRETVRKLFANLGSAVKDDARMIEAAVNLRRSSTGRRNRGYGLQRDIRRYVQSHDSTGSLRIISNRGSYRFDKNRNGQEASMLKNLSASVGGTFIEWVIEDYARALI